LSVTSAIMARRGMAGAGQKNMQSLIELIVGRAIEQAVHRGERPVDRSGTPLLELQGVSTGTGVRDVDLKIHEGEIVGLAGLMGSGRSELARAVFGIDRLDRGRVLVRGREVRIRRPGDAVDQGIVLVPEDRRSQGLVLDHGVAGNLTLPLLRRRLSAA
jgi:ribose transport system ATP-binding protein